MDVLQTKSVRGIFCEKPLDTNLEKAQRLVEAAAQKEVALAVNYIRRFDSAYVELKRGIQQREFGDIQAINGYYGKGLLRNGTHWIDLLRYLFGEVAWVEGSATGLSFEGDATCNAWFGMQAGFNAFLHGTDHTAFTLFEMDIVGSLQRAHLTQGGRLISYYTRQASNVIPDDYGLGTEPFTTAMALETPVLDGVSNLVTHLEGRGALVCTGNDGVSALEIAQAVQLSAQAGARVNLVH
jgi:predicted dehydrogenase